MKSEFENWFLSTPTGKALSTPNLGYYIFERHLGEYRDRDVEMAHRAYVYQQSKIVELQDRINEALEDLEYPTAPWDETIASVVKALRGASD